MNLKDKEYIVVVQCHIVKERCSGYFCEKAFFEKTGLFADYAKDKQYRTLNITCGGCCGRGTQRKLSNLIHKIKEKEDIDKDKISVHLSTCIVKESYHGPICPHLDYLKKIIDKLNLDIICGTKISKTAEKKREKGIYKK